MIYYINNYTLSLNLIEKYSYKWNYYFLSYNPNITEEFILKYPYQNWNIEYIIEKNKITDFKSLSKFKNITQRIIKKYPNKLWDQEWMILNTNIKLEKYIPFNLIEKYSYKWDYWKLSKNPNLTEEFILKYPYQDWNIGYLINNNKITDFKSLSKFINIYSYINNYPDKPWDWEWIIENTDIELEKYIPFNLIEKYRNRLNYYKLSEYQDITEEFILKYPYQDWNIGYLIRNKKITDFKSLSKFININREIINNYQNKPWDWEWLIENTDNYVEEYISLNLIEKYPCKWNYYFLSKNINLTQDFILKYPYQNWDIKYLIKNDKITGFKSLSNFKYINEYIIYIIDKYSKVPQWDWEWIIKNININIEKYIPFNLIEKYPYKWDYQILSKNPNLTEELILKYSYKNWDIEYLSKKFILKKIFYKLIIK